MNMRIEDADAGVRWRFGVVNSSSYPEERFQVCQAGTDEVGEEGRKRCEMVNGKSQSWL